MVLSRFYVEPNDSASLQKSTVVELEESTIYFDPTVGSQNIKYHKHIIGYSDGVYISEV